MDGSGPDHFDSLMADARSAAPNGFDGLARSVERQLVGFLRARGADDAEGLANDVLVRVFRHLDRFDGGLAAFRAWVFTIARNRLIDERRRRSRQVESVLRAPEAMPESRAPDAIDRLDDTSRVERLLAQLTDEQREVVLLRVVAGLSVAETAEVVGLREGAVRALQHRGLAALHRNLTTTVTR
jgi:RNA polymerase sigma factor (sigma-70 family)